MSQYYINPDSPLNTENPQSGFTRHIGTTSTLTAVTSKAWSKIGAIELNNTATGTQVWGYDLVDGISDNIEIAVNFGLTSDVGKQGIASLRYSGTSEATTKGYTLSGSVISGAGTLAIDEGSTGYVVWTPWNYLPANNAGGNLYSARFRIDGNRLRAKVWTMGGTEPDWMLDTTNDVTSTGNFNGLHTYASGNVDYFSVGFGTNGDSAPLSALPVTTVTATIQGNASVSPLPQANIPAFGVTYGTIGYGTIAIPAQATKQLSQSGNSRIRKNNATTINGNSRIIKTIQSSQTGNSRIQSVKSLIKQGNARIRIKELTTIKGNSRIQRTNSITQTGNAQLSSAVYTYSQDIIGNACIQNVKQATLNGNARIQAVNNLTQTGSAVIATAHTIIQSGTARISQTSIITQPGNARVNVVKYLNQVGNAAVQHLASIDQQGTARIRISLEAKQIGNARIRTARSIAISGIARIINRRGIDQIGHADIFAIPVLSIVGNALINNKSIPRPAPWVPDNDHPDNEWNTTESVPTQQWAKEAEKESSTWSQDNNHPSGIWEKHPDKPSTWVNIFYDN